MASSPTEDTRPWSQLNQVTISFLYITQQVASNGKAYDLYYRVSNLISAGRQNFSSLLVITKIVIDNKTIEQVNLFNYLGNIVSYEGELDIDNKLSNFFKITSILNNVFRPQKSLRKKRIKLGIQYTRPSSFVIWQRNLDY